MAAHVFAVMTLNIDYIYLYLLFDCNLCLLKTRAITVWFPVEYLGPKLVLNEGM